MNDAGKIIAGALAVVATGTGIGLYIHYNGKADAGKNLKFSTAGITPSGFKNGNASADLTLEVRNNRRSSLTITSIDLAVMKEGEVIARVIQYPDAGFQKHEISKNKISTITVPLQFGILKSIGGVIKSFADAWKGTTPFTKQVEGMTLKGEIRADGFLIPIDLPLYYA